ncbi:MAG: hypothetical protein EXX96DRAFT_485207 [Benjaminiella poitrasii]|nr:MAG: hypothetical protein EXX96DRAFT_485207 [Benjaminiella poitrasii]
MNGATSKSKQIDSSSSLQSLSTTLKTHNTSNDRLSSHLKNEEGVSASSSPTSPNSPNKHSFSQKKNGKNQQKETAQQQRLQQQLKNGKGKSPSTSNLASEYPGISKATSNSNIRRGSTLASIATNASQQDAVNTDKRAANYKFARRNVSPIGNGPSKVGSIILEFDALANKSDSKTSDDSAAWLLLGNKALQTRPYNTARATSSLSQRAPLTNLFPTTSSTSTSSQLLASSYAYQNFNRKDASRLATSSIDKDNKRNQDCNSPYYYVERLRSRNIATEHLTKHLTSLRVTLATGNVSWINEFLSRRHDGLAALENILQKFALKRTKYICFLIVDFLMKSKYYIIRCFNVEIYT